MDMPNQPESALSISQLNQLVKETFHVNFPQRLWVRGEVSNCRTPRSGHCYFVLKDGQAEVRCVMFSLAVRRLGFVLQDGVEIVCSAQISLYEARGEYQLIAEFAQEGGDGALYLEFLRIKQVLESEGLFDTQRKRPIVAMPRCIGVVTSPTGAAIRDIVIVLRRRFPLARVVVYPAAVQGAQAEGELVQAVRVAGARRECETLIVARGGGSAEDLAVFNAELLARAVAACPMPVISGVGHETDTTIIDLVADVRAATPSAAAEYAVPDQVMLKAQVTQSSSRMAFLVNTRLISYRQRLEALSQRLRSPIERFYRLAQRLDFLEASLRRAMSARLQQAYHRLENLSDQLAQLNPQGVLKRGYAMVETTQAQISCASQLSAGDRVQVVFSDGLARCQVEAIELHHEQ